MLEEIGYSINQILRAGDILIEKGGVIFDILQDIMLNEEQNQNKL